MIGSALDPFLKESGHAVRPLRRGEPLPREPVDAVVHLAGENIASGRWTSRKKNLIRESRTVGTGTLVESLLKLKPLPKVFLSASAVGFYGDRGETLVDENDGPGTGFLPEVCQEWENASKPLKDKGVRVVHLRFGVVLSSKGGALGKMLFPFKCGLGGPLGSGNQYMSWVSIHDAVRVIGFCLTREGVEGPVNVVAPAPVTNLSFTKTLGRVLKRPTPFPMPSFVARLLFGEMADALLLTGCRVEPARLTAAGYKFDHPDLENALRSLLEEL